MNPYPKPASGSYLNPLVAGLNAIGRPTEAFMFKNGALKLGFVASFTGSVKTQPELTPVCIAALKALAPHTDVIGYYIHQLENNLAVPASTSGAYTYDENDPAAVAFVKARLEQDAKRVYAPGELFFKS